MHFDYMDMLSGEPIYLESVGHIKSPKLRDLFPTSGIGSSGYNLYLNFLSWDKETLIKYDQLFHIGSSKRLSDSRLTIFDVITLREHTREFCRGILSFFMTENLIWNDDTRSYFVISDDPDPILVGIINRDNFDTVRKVMLQLNYVGLDKQDKPIGHSSEHSQELWEKAQGFIKKQAEKAQNEDKGEFHLSNIISKVCASHPSYNFLNVYDLTIFQLYDAFFQIGYLRSADLSEKVFSNHGGDKFRFEDWLKPIFKNI